jgi:hypothetical protein
MLARQLVKKGFRSAGKPTSTRDTAAMWVSRVVTRATIRFRSWKWREHPRQPTTSSQWKVGGSPNCKDGETHGPHILLELPVEERSLLEPLLKVGEEQSNEL